MFVLWAVATILFLMFRLMPSNPLAAYIDPTFTEEQQAAVTKHSGMAIALLAGFAWTNGDTYGESQLIANDVEFITLPEEDVAAAREILSPLETEWLEQANERGFDGEAILNYARAMVEHYDTARVVNVVQGRGPAAPDTVVPPAVPGRLVSSMPRVLRWGSRRYSTRYA